jgi:hypothetical protein
MTNSASVRLAATFGLLASALFAAPVSFKDRCLADLVAEIPGILKSQDRATGRFGKGIWIVTDQNLMLPLAAAWSFRHAGNPYYHKPALLDAIMAAGDALIEDQDSKGQWVFRKKDGSTWGKIYMPWTYSRWIRSFLMIRDAMPAERRARWEKALLLGYTGIAAEVAKARVQNIPAHHAMGLYFAGTAFDKPEWHTLATTYLRRVASAQHSDGYWTEHVGPVVNYGFVYVDALGAYLAASHDETIRPILHKSAEFHSHFTYPDGTPVETIDERNPYHGGVTVPNVGFTFSPEGRSYLARQLALHRDRISADEAASLLLWGEEGEGAPETAGGDFDYTLPSGDAAVRRRGPWFLVVSGLTASQSDSRWIQDRQNFVSVYHDKAGLILGGGNTKMQPRWSNFTVGNVDLLQHKPGDENPQFLVPPGLVHVPSRARVLRGDDFGVELDYADHRGRITLKIVSPERLEYTWSGDAQMAAHITLLPHLDQQPKQSGAWLEYGGVRFHLPDGMTLHWPVLPHDPYRKDGHAEPAQARAVLDGPAGGSRTITIEIKNSRTGN